MVGRETKLSELQGSITGLNQELAALRDRINTEEFLSGHVKVCVPSTNH